MFEWFMKKEKPLKKWPASVPPLEIEELKMSKERGIEVSMSHPLFAKLTDEMCQMFEESGATNYVEWQVYSEKYGLFSVTLQRVNGETPAAQNDRLKAKIQTLKKELKEAKDKLAAKNSSQVEGREVY